VEVGVEVEAAGEEVGVGVGVGAGEEVGVGVGVGVAAGRVEVVDGGARPERGTGGAAELRATVCGASRGREMVIGRITQGLPRGQQPCMSS
jgi:hypothetical protein